MHKKNIYSLFFTLFFALVCVPSSTAPQGRELFTTRKGGSTFKFYHSLNLTLSQNQNATPTHHVITLDKEEYAQFSKDFSKHRSQKWTRSQSAPYVQQVAEIIENGISTNILFQLPQPNSSVYVELNFDLLHDAKLNGTTQVVTVQLTTATTVLDASVLNFFKSIMLPDGFFTRNGSKLSMLAVVAGWFAFKAAHKEAFKKRSAINRINGFRVDLAAALAKKFGINPTEVFEAQADSASLRPSPSNPIWFGSKLDSIPTDKKLVVISCSTLEAFEQLERNFEDKLTQDKYLEQIKILLIPISYHYSMGQETKPKLQKYGWQIIFVNDTDREILPTDRLPNKTARHSHGYYSYYSHQTLSEEYSDIPWLYAPCPLFDTILWSTHCDIYSNTPNAGTTKQAIHIETANRTYQQILKALTQIIKDSRKPFFKTMGVSADDTEWTASSKAKSSTTAQQRRSNPGMQSAYRVFVNKKLREQYANVNMSHDEFMAMPQARAAAIAQASQKLKEAFVTLNSFPDAGESYYSRAMVGRDDISTIVRAIDPTTPAPAKVVILGIPDEDILEDISLLQPLLSADQYLTQVKVLLIPWSIIEDCEATTLAALKVLTAECSIYRWQVIFINDTDKEIRAQRSEHVYLSNIFLKADNIQSWKLLKKPVATGSSTYFTNYYVATETFNAQLNQFEYDKQINLDLRTYYVNYYEALASIITDSRKPYFKAINASASWKTEVVQARCSESRTTEAYRILTDVQARARYLTAASHADFRAKEAARAAAEEQARRAEEYAQREKARRAAEAEAAQREKARRAATDCPNEQRYGSCYGGCDYRHKPRTSSSGYGAGAGYGTGAGSYARPGGHSTPFNDEYCPFEESGGQCPFYGAGMFGFMGNCPFKHRGQGGGGSSRSGGSSSYGTSSGAGAGRRTNQAQCISETDSTLSGTLMCPEHTGFINGQTDYPKDCTKGTHDDSKYGCPEEGKGRPCSKRNTGCPYAHLARASRVSRPAKKDFDLVGVSGDELANVHTLPPEIKKLIALAKSPSERTTIIKEAQKTKTNEACRSKLKILKESSEESGAFTELVEAKKRIIAWIDYLVESGILK